MLVQPPPELQQAPDVLWQLTRALYGIQADHKLWQQSLATKLEEIGLRKNKVESGIFTSGQLIVIHHQEALLIVGDKQQQDSFISQLSASVSLTDTTKLDAQTPLTFMNQILEHNHHEHSISMHLPVPYYMKLLNMYGIESATSTSTLEEQLCPSKSQRNYSKPLASAKQKFFKTAVGHLLWATSVRPDISFAVNELSRSLQAPTQQNEQQQLRQVLRYIKGTLHFTTSLQPPRKRVIDRASSIRIHACYSVLEGSNRKKKPASGATLSLRGVPLAAFSRIQASSKPTSAEAELYAMGMVVHHSFYLKSFLQEIQHWQGSCTNMFSFRYVFMKDLRVHGQLHFRKIPAGKNVAIMLTTCFPTSTFHTLLPKFGVRTRAVDSKDLLSVLNIKMLASSREEQSSFFVRMMAEQFVPTQLVASSVASLPTNSFLQPWAHRGRSETVANANANANSDAPRKRAGEFSAPNLKQKAAN